MNNYRVNFNSCSIKVMWYSSRNHTGSNRLLSIIY